MMRLNTHTDKAASTQLPSDDSCLSVDSRLRVDSSLSSPDPGSDLLKAVEAMRAAQRRWHQIGVRPRLHIIRRLAGLVAEHAAALADDVVRPVPIEAGEILASEILPLADAIHYVTRRGPGVLARRRLPRRDAAWWMGSIRVWEEREPLGIVLLIGPSNYPLLLPGVQLVQALAAGNGVLVKPAPACVRAIERLAALCELAGVPNGLVDVLPGGPEAARAAIDMGVDKVVLTGSYATGQAVARQLAETLTPAAMELSGNDAVFVLEDADLQRVAKSVAFALRLNGGQTCIAPRRLFATRASLERLVPLLRRELEPAVSRASRTDDVLASSPPAVKKAREAIDASLAQGAELVCGDLAGFQAPGTPLPIVLGKVRPQMRVATEDIFAPVLSLIETVDMEDALKCAQASPLALGASIFGSSQRAVSYAAQVTAGCITINDVLVPTADPRVSFGGWKASGYGMTRGLEGLREMTRLKVTCQRRGRWLPHLTTDPAKLEPLMRGLLLVRYGRSLGQRWQGLKMLMQTSKRADAPRHNGANQNQDRRSTG